MAEDTNDLAHAALEFLIPEEFRLEYGKLEKGFPAFQHDGGECGKSLNLSVAV